MQVFDGEEGLYEAESGVYDLILLDLMLPEKNGFQVLKELREKGITTPVLIMTAKESLDDKGHGFELGADDYLTKPFYLEELKMRIQALLKRSGKFNENTLTYGNIVVNLSTNTVKVEDTPVELLGKEFDLLVYFLQNQNVILPKTQIFDRLWGFDSDTTISVVEVYVSKVRKKLKGTTFAENLQTLRSVGYILKDVQSVSYTHLDVYKRQVLCMLNLSWIKVKNRKKLMIIMKCILWGIIEMQLLGKN